MLTVETFLPTRVGTLLGIWAHPDDEAYLSAGLMATVRQSSSPDCASGSSNRASTSSTSASTCGSTTGTASCRRSRTQRGSNSSSGSSAPCAPTRSSRSVPRA